MAGEVDWWQQVPADLVPLLQKAGGITVTAPDTVGSVGVFGLNHQQAPFNNPKLRQAMLYAVDQKDYMSAAAGDQKYWRTCYSYYPCNTPNASEAGAEALMAPRDLAKAKALVKESGYKGERIVLLDATDYSAVHAEAAVTADLLQQLGLKVEVQAMDWGSVLTRRAKHGSVEEGGWSIYHTSLSGADAIDPAVSLGLRGNGDKAWFGWPEDPQMEALRDRWIDSEDPVEQKRIAVDLQVQAFKTVPFIPLGRFDIPTAYRKTLDGIILAPLLVMWNVEKR
jgi:peptide/nickel transport system substrate-binding protein